MTDYPFVPKSNRFLKPGQFFAIPLSNGRFAAGRITAVPAFGPTDRKGVVIGLEDWSGSAPPTEIDIAGRPLLAQGKTSCHAITESGGAVLGERDLSLDGITPVDPDDRRVGAVHPVWGRRVIVAMAEEAFSPGPMRRVHHFIDFPTEEKASAAARKFQRAPEVRHHGGRWRVVLIHETVVPLEHSEGLFRGYAKMLNGEYAGYEVV